MMSDFPVTEMKKEKYDKYKHFIFLIIIILACKPFLMSRNNLFKKNLDQYI